MTNDLAYLWSDYFATGEGRTVSVMICQIVPVDADWETAPSFDWETGYVPGTLRSTREEILQRMFAATFNAYFALGTEILDRKEFFQRGGDFLRQALQRIRKEDANAVRYHAQLYVNYS